MPEIHISVEHLRNRRLFFATPMFGGKCDGIFASSIAELSTLCANHAIHLQYYFLFNESLIQRARNYCCNEFLRSPATHLMFVDSDIGFSPKDVLALLALQSEDSPYDVIGAAYPKKRIPWGSVREAVRKGLAEKEPSDLQNLVGDFVVNPVLKEAKIPLDRPCEVAELGAGFTMIRRATLEKYKEAYPKRMYVPDDILSRSAGNGSAEICSFFNVEIVPERDNRLLSEDYMFSYEIRKIGMKVWLCPWMKLQHAGSYVFSGSLPEVAQIYR